MYSVSTCHLHYCWRIWQSWILTHWGRVRHICGKLITIGSDNGLSPDRRQAIIWTNAGLLSIGPLRTYFSENLIKILQFWLKKMHVKMSSAKWRPSCLGLNVLKGLCAWILHPGKVQGKSLNFINLDMWETFARQCTIKLCAYCFGTCNISKDIELLDGCYLHAHWWHHIMKDGIILDSDNIISLRVHIS